MECDGGYLNGAAEEGGGPIDPRASETSGEILRRTDGGDGARGHDPWQG
jgi:hypothetical protein